MSCPSLDFMFEDPSSINIKMFLAVDVPITTFTIFGNIIFLITLIKTKSLHTPSNIILGALCFSDLLVGFIAQPVCITFYFQAVVARKINQTRVAISGLISHLCVGLSLVYTLLGSIDRYLAICQPYQYHAKATNKTHLIIVFICGAMWVTVACAEFVRPLRTAYGIFNSIFLLGSIMAILFSWVRIIKVMKSHQRAIATSMMSQPSREELRRRIAERKKTYTIGTVVAVLIFCYTPLAAVTIHFIISHRYFCWYTQTDFIITLWAVLLVNVNSLLNPLIYYMRSVDFREAAMRVLCTKENKLN